MNPDFSERTYTAEVMKTEVARADAVKTICRLTTGARHESECIEGDGRVVRLVHSFVATKLEFHRTTRTVIGIDGKEFDVPRRENVRGVDCYLYDVFLAYSENHIVVAVPFHELAEQFFPKIDRALAGTRTLYEKLDITAMVMRLGAAGNKDIQLNPAGQSLGISVTRCHLAYAGSEDRVPNLQQIRMTGANLRAAEQYQTLIGPVLSPGKTSIVVTPLVLGFALSVNGVKKSSATTDRHGNFKLWIAPGLRRLTRIFALLAAIEHMDNVVSTTSNLPILQSKAIETAED